jgi:para-aminobenzoate synthetase component 1
LIRTDLNLISHRSESGKIQVYPKIKTSGKDLLQVSSKFQANCTRALERRLGEIFTTLLPAGSISGAPKQKTLELFMKPNVIPREVLYRVSLSSTAIM